MAIKDDVDSLIGAFEDIQHHTNEVVRKAWAEGFNTGICVIRTQMCESGNIGTEHIKTEDFYILSDTKKEIDEL